MKRPKANVKATWKNKGYRGRRNMGKTREERGGGEGEMLRELVRLKCIAILTMRNH
jgi:hypothetical protein